MLTHHPVFLTALMMILLTLIQFWIQLPFSCSLQERLVYLLRSSKNVLGSVWHVRKYSLSNTIIAISAILLPRFKHHSCHHSQPYRLSIRIGNILLEYIICSCRKYYAAFFIWQMHKYQKFAPAMRLREVNLFMFSLYIKHWAPPSYELPWSNCYPLPTSYPFHIL